MALGRSQPSEWSYRMASLSILNLHKYNAPHAVEWVLEKEGIAFGASPSHPSIEEYQNNVLCP